MRIEERDVGEDRRFVKIAVREPVRGERVAAAGEPSTLFVPDLHVSGDGLTLIGADRRTHVRGGIETIADAKRACPRGKAIQRTRGYALVHDNPARRRAALTRSCQSHPRGSLQRRDPGSASSMIMMTFLPPISRWTFLKSPPSSRKPCGLPLWTR